MQFLPRKQLEDFYTKVILPSVTYGLVVWGSCNKTHFSNLEIFQARAGRIMYGLHVSWDASTADVLMQTRWDSLERMYEVRLAGFTFKCVKELQPHRTQGPICPVKVEGTEKLSSQAQRQINFYEEVHQI